MGPKGFHHNSAQESCSIAEIYYQLLRQDPVSGTYSS